MQSPRKKPFDGFCEKATRIESVEQVELGNIMTAVAILEPEPATSAARDVRESPIGPDPNPKRRLLMKSAYELKSVSEELNKEQKDWLEEVMINEALAEEVQRGGK